MQELLHLSFQQLGTRDVRPPAHDLGDIFLVHFLFNEPGRALLVGKTVFFRLELAFQRVEGSILELGSPVEIVLALGQLDLGFGLLDLLAEVAQVLHGLFLRLPAGPERVAFGLQIGKFFFEFPQPFLGGGIALFAERFALDFQLHHPAGNLIELAGHRVNLGAQLGGRFVHQVNRLVR